MSLFDHALTRRFALAMGMAFAASTLPAMSHAQALPKVNIGVSTLSTDWLPIFVADKCTRGVEVTFVQRLLVESLHDDLVVVRHYAHGFPLRYGMLM